MCRERLFQTAQLLGVCMHCLPGWVWSLGYFMTWSSSMSAWTRRVPASVRCPQLWQLWALGSNRENTHGTQAGFPWTFLRLPHCTVLALSTPLSLGQWVVLVSSFLLVRKLRHRSVRRCRDSSACLQTHILLPATSGLGLFHQFFTFWMYIRKANNH